MGERIWTFIRVNIWIVIGSILVFLIVSSRGIREWVVGVLATIFDQVEIGNKIIDLVELESWGVWSRVAVSLAVFVTFSWLQYYLQDYSQFLPSHLTFSVEFQTDLLDAELKKFNEIELKSRNVHIPDNWKPLRLAYLGDRNEHILSNGPDCGFRFSTSTKGRGYFSFKIAKRSDEPQSYQADETTFGIVDFSYRRADRVDTIMARFVLIEDTYQYFKVSLKEILFPHGSGWRRFLNRRRSTVVRPRLSQTAYVGLTKHEWIGSIVALSRIEFFPTVVLKSTLYLAETPEPIRPAADDGLGGIPLDETSSSEQPIMIPIAFAKYD